MSIRTQQLLSSNVTTDYRLQTADAFRVSNLPNRSSGFIVAALLSTSQSGVDAR